MTVGYNITIMTKEIKNGLKSNKAGIVLLLAMILLLGGCSKDTEITGDAIVFTCWATKVRDSKAVTATENNMQYFRVSAVWNKSGMGYDAGFMSNQLVEKQGTNWVYSPIKYFPNYGSVNFFAYSPAISSGLQSFAIDNTTYDAVAIAYHVSTNPLLQEDFVAASLLNKSDNSTAVQLDFKHVLSQIEFQAKGVSGDTVFVIEKIELHNLDSAGSLTGTSSWSWTDNTAPSEKTAVYTVYQDAPLQLTNDFQSLTNAHIGNLMILPQEVTAGANGDGTTQTPPDLSSGFFYIAVTYTAHHTSDPNSGNNITAYYTLGTTTEPFEFKMGEKYTFYLTLDKGRKSAVKHAVFRLSVGN